MLRRATRGDGVWATAYGHFERCRGDRTVHRALPTRQDRLRAEMGLLNPSGARRRPVCPGPRLDPTSSLNACEVGRTHLDRLSGLDRLGSSSAVLVRLPLLRLEDKPPTGLTRTPEKLQQPRVPWFGWIHFVTLKAEMTSKEWSPPPVVTSSFSKKQLCGKGRGPF